MKALYSLFLECLEYIVYCREIKVRIVYLVTYDFSVVQCGANG